MNETERELNLFFNSCQEVVRSNSSYIRQFIQISEQDIKYLRAQQPNIDIALVTKIIAEKAGYYQKEISTGKRKTIHSFYKEQFDNVLSSLWFCYYRFLFFHKLNKAEYKDIALDVVYNSFLKLMKYIKLDVINSGKQITALLTLVLQCNLVNEFQRLQKNSLFYQNGVVSFDESIDEEAMIDNGFFDNIINSIYKPNYQDKKETLICVVEYLSEQMPHEYELQQNLQDLISGKQKDLSDYSKQVIHNFLSENDFTSEDVILLAIQNKKEYNTIIDEILKNTE